MKTEELDIQTIVKNALTSAMSYTEYRELHSRRVANYVPNPTGEKPDMEFYAKMNDQRMRRLDKKLYLTEETIDAIKSIKKKQVWLLITEDWCGDAAQVVPYLNAMASQSDLIDVQIVYRDQNIELMDEFLTDGARSIPKLIILDPESFEILGTWGPRPAEAQKLRMDLKEKNEPMLDVATELQKWYTKNKGVNIQNEVLNTINNIS